ncbi:MAG: hypothetical protein MZV65_14680 [Chromatiales bacterium]|nr:hypothetical protein [Chromatiales bacterium]
MLQAAETAIREIVGKSKMDFVLYEGRERGRRARDSKLMQEILDRYKTGIQHQQGAPCRTPSRRSRCRPPSTTRCKAGQDRERLKNEGQAYANDVDPARPRRRRAPDCEEAERLQADA